MHELLTEKNYTLYCAKHYDAKQCASDKEFYEDLNRIKYIKKLLTRYRDTKILKERLILNHIIVLNNVFGPIHSSRILFFKLQTQFDCIKPFLLLLNILPEKYFNIGVPNTIFYTDDYGMDAKIIMALRAL